MSASAYLERIATMVESLRREQLGRIEDAAGIVADALRRDAIVHLFGTGHSHVLAEEALYRAGGLAPVNAILDPGLMLRDGALASTRLERVSGYADMLRDGRGQHDLGAARAVPAAVLARLHALRPPRRDAGGVLMARRVIVRYLLVIGVLGIVVIPFLWILLGSLRPNSELISPGGQFDVKSVSLDNYENLGEAADYGTFLRNSLIVAVITTAISVPLAVLAAYSLYRTRYRGRRFLFRLMIITYVFPGVVLLIPLYQLFGRMGLIDNLWSLIIMNVTFSAPFSVWLMRGFFTSIPQGIEEAAALDGAGPLRTLWSVILPLTAPGLAVAAMYTFVLSWTEYMFASAFILDDAWKTLPVGLGAFIAQYNIDWGILTAAAVATLAPVVLLFAFLGKYFVEGLTAGAEK
jgi:multiple sugar transport system permease protein